MRLKRPSVHVARAIERALSSEMVTTLRPAARGDAENAPRRKKAHQKPGKPDALVLAFQQALLRNPPPGEFQPIVPVAGGSSGPRNRRCAKMLMVRKKTKSFANQKGTKVRGKLGLGVRKR
jgi:hypothetical protein